MGKQIMVCSYKGVVSAMKKKWNTDTRNNISETKKHYIE